MDWFVGRNTPPALSLTLRHYTHARPPLPRAPRSHTHVLKGQHNVRDFRLKGGQASEGPTDITWFTPVFSAPFLFLSSPAAPPLPHPRSPPLACKRTPFSYFCFLKHNCVWFTPVFSAPFLFLSSPAAPPLPHPRSPPLACKRTPFSYFCFLKHNCVRSRKGGSSGGTCRWTGLERGGLGLERGWTRAGAAWSGHVTRKRRSHPF